jgi:hypothetical protein
MAKPNDLAACQATPGSDWILAKVIQHDPASSLYKLSDEDVESNKSKYTRNYACFCFWIRLAVDIPWVALDNVAKLVRLFHSIVCAVFHLPESQVVVLGDVDKLTRGDVIYAVYPDTTSFYQATVVQLPRKNNPGAFVMVHFVDDSDEFGVTHDKAIPLKYIMLPP